MFPGYEDPAHTECPISHISLDMSGHSTHEDHGADDGTSPAHTWKDFVAGTAGGCLGVLVGHPLDTVKVRLQNDHSKEYRSTWHCTRKIVKTEGALGLYKGMTSPLFGVAAINSLLFGVYGYFLSKQLSDPQSIPTLTNVFVAGSLSGCPMELVKIRLQQNHTPVPSKLHYNIAHHIPNPKPAPGSETSPIALIRHIYKTNGIRGFYRGFSATLFRETPSYGIYFVSYEIAINVLGSSTSNEDQAASDNDSKSTWAILIAGAVAGMVGWASTYPFDVAKTQLQTDTHMPSTKLLDAFRDIIRKQGKRKLFAGLGACMIRAVPTNAATFLGVELTRRLLG